MPVDPERPLEARCPDQLRMLSLLVRVLRDVLERAAIFGRQLETGEQDGVAETEVQIVDRRLVEDLGVGGHTAHRTRRRGGRHPRHQRPPRRAARTAHPVGVPAAPSTL